MSALRHNLAAMRGWLAPRAHLGRALEGFRARRRFLRDLRSYLALDGAEPLRPADLAPRLGDWTATTPFDAHYFHMGAWAARHLLADRPAHHVDVGSEANFVGILAAITEVEFVDIRPLAVELPGLTARTGSVLALPYPSRSLASLSCLHVAEHVGLGRYGDALDPDGTRKAAAELARVLAPGGTLLFALPVGRERLCFNAHRVHAAASVAAYFAELELVEFSGVDDAGTLHRNVSLDRFRHADYGCGLFRFRRPPS